MNILLSGFSCLVTGKEGFALNGANCEVKLLESRRQKRMAYQQKSKPALVTTGVLQR